MSATVRSLRSSVRLRARAAGLGLVLAALAPVYPAGPARAASDTAGKTTVDQRIVRDPTPVGTFAYLALGPGHPYVTREDLVAASPGRTQRRRSLTYFAQLTDFQLADEESPARVEFVDTGERPPPGEAPADDDSPDTEVSGAWRPQEALHPWAIDSAIRQINRFADASPVQQGNGSRARMGFAITTGDSADNQQLNETEWVVRLLEGGMLDPNSGVDDRQRCPLTPPDEAANYTGVQDYGDYYPNTQFYDPDQPAGRYGGWPAYPGLMDRAQQRLPVAGLAVPSYVTLGNHDGLAQGNQAANASFEAVGTGCLKPVPPSPSTLQGALANLTPSFLAGLASDQVMRVPHDPKRQYVSKAQYKAVHDTGAQADEHGFAFVDRAELDASRGAAAYYAWQPERGFRFIALDTVSDGGVSGRSHEGNIDDPQFRWLERELEAASERDELIVLFGHHPVRRLRADILDEVAPPCTVADSHGHDVNPGCDVDPRPSGPVHLGRDPRSGDPRESLVELLARYPNVIAFVAGHTHENRVTPFRRPSGGGWWGIETAAEGDWPAQTRLLEVMDNQDGTLSMFGTALDNEAPTQVPPSGTSAITFDDEALAAVQRTLSFNDPQAGEGTGEGRPEDQNIELLLPDPRSAGADRRPPLLSGLRVRPRVLKAAARGATILARTGAGVSYRLSEPARVRFTFQRGFRGRKVGRRCLRETRSNRRHQRCVRRYSRHRSPFAHSGREGANRFRFSGRVARRKLRRGRYRLVATPVDAAGNSGRTARAGFRIRP